MNFSTQKKVFRKNKLMNIILKPKLHQASKIVFFIGCRCDESLKTTDLITKYPLLVHFSLGKNVFFKCAFDLSLLNYNINHTFNKQIHLTNVYLKLEFKNFELPISNIHKKLTFLSL